jgi:actin-like ATPase involved in cell morphogenesis
MPTVALPRADGTTLVGEAADALSPYEPTLVARMVTARLGQPGPIVLDGTPCDPLVLTEALVGAAVDRVALRAGAGPDHVVLAYPLRPSDEPELLLAEAAGRVVGHVPAMVPAPVAAVAKLAHDRDVGAGTTIAVVDFGGSTVDVTLVRRTETAFDLVGEPASLPALGGVDLDAVMLALVEGAIGDITSMVDTHDHAAMAALRQVRTSCRDAKERLSTEHIAVVEVALPHARGRVEVTRDAFERAIEAPLSELVDLVLSTIDDAGLTAGDVGLALLVGGSARIPRLAQVVAEHTGLTAVTDAAPELTVAQGAALFAEVVTAEAGAPAAAPAPPPAGFDTGPVAPFPAAPPPAGFDTGPVAPFDTGSVPQPFDTGPRPPFDTGRSPDDWAVPTATAGWPPPAGPAAPAEWSPDEPWELEPAAQFDPGDRWDDPRTSVFDPPPTHGPVAPAHDPTMESGTAGRDDEFQRLTTSATDPFGSRAGTLSARLRDRSHEPDEHDDDGGAFDMRLVVGGVVAAVVVVLVAGFALLSGTSGTDDPAIAVADTAPTTQRTTATTATSTTTTVPSTTEASTTTTEEPTTTTRPRPRPTAPTTVAPAPAPPPPSTPTTSATPTTRPSTTRPTRTTTTTTTTIAGSTTTTTPGPPGNN